MKCRICGKNLTAQGSFLGIGPVCRKHRAEAMQLKLEETEATQEELEQWKNAQEFEVIDYDALRGKE